MPRPHRVLRCLLLVLALPASALAAQEPPPGPAVLEAPDALAPARAHVEQAIEKGRYRGAVALVEQGGEPTLTLAAGERAEGAAMDLDTIFRIYSMTKPVTAVAALMLVDEGELDLDAPVARYLPALEDLEVSVRKKDDEGRWTQGRAPCAQPMKVRDLLTHTSGLTYGFFGRSEADRLLLRANVLGPGVTTATMVERLAGVPLKHQPGTRFEYSVSSDVLGRVVEVVSGKTLDVVFEERIFAPLGMVDTGFTVPEEKRGRVATCHVRGRGGLRPARAGETMDPSKDATLLSGGGGLYSTAPDYLRFCRMLLGEGALGEVRLLRAETAREMMSDQLNGRPAPMLALSGGAFGHGLAVHTPERRRGPHSGTVWWGGLAGTGFWVDREADLIGVFMIQNMNEATHASAFRTAVYGAMGR